MPAQAGIQGGLRKNWIPAFAGMTIGRHQFVLEFLRYYTSWCDRISQACNSRWQSFRFASFVGEAQVFPGVSGPVTPVGDGVTHRLSRNDGTRHAALGARRSGQPPGDPLQLHKRQRLQDLHGAGQRRSCRKKKNIIGAVVVD